MSEVNRQRLNEFSESVYDVTGDFVDVLRPVLEKLYSGLLEQHGLEDEPRHWGEFCHAMDYWLCGGDKE